MVFDVFVEGVEGSLLQSGRGGEGRECDFCGGGDSTASCDAARSIDLRDSLDDTVIDGGCRPSSLTDSRRRLSADERGGRQRLRGSNRLCFAGLLADEGLAEGLRYWPPFRWDLFLPEAVVEGTTWWRAGSGHSDTGDGRENQCSLHGVSGINQVLQSQ